MAPAPAHRGTRARGRRTEKNATEWSKKFIQEKLATLSVEAEGVGSARITEVTVTGEATAKCGACP